MTINEILKNQSIPAVLDSLIAGIFIVDVEGVVRFWSSGAERITGYGREEVLGKHCSFLESSTCAAFDCKEGKMNCGLFHGKTVRDVKCTFKNKDGRIIHVVRNAGIVKNKAGRPVGGIESITDVTAFVCAERELEELRRAVKKRVRFGRLIGKSPIMQEIYTLIEEVSDSNATVLITGESGTGKELIAEAVHFQSPRKTKPLIKVACAALPESLLESELFGHVRGAFTGAVADKQGRFELADGGTLFLDEIGDLTPAVQVKLLRVIQQREFERVGSGRPVKTDVRIIAATNRDLAGLVRDGKFREDLFYRLNVIPVRVPPLRDRREDIPLLIAAFVDTFNKSTGKKIKGVDEDAMALLLDYDWPGNIRELENAVEHAFVRTREDVIRVFALPQNLRMIKYAPRAALPDAAGVGEAVFAGRPRLSKEIIEKGLVRAGYHRSRLAKILGISRTTLWKKMKELGLSG